MSTDERTKLATGLNRAQPNSQYRQVCAIVPPELFELIKAEAVRCNVSISEILRQCVELVLK